MKHAFNDESSKEISKYTLEAVFQAQESIRKHLDVLIEENRCLKDDGERDLFFRELTYSTLGLGVKFVIFYRIPQEFLQQKYIGYVGIRRDVETTARWLGDQKEHMVMVPLELYTSNTLNENERVKVPIGYLWKFLKENLFSVFPLAIDRACRMSKEREERTGESEFDVDG
jgi:hypothetical protein